MNLGNRYSQYKAAQVPDVRMARSRFDRSFTVKDTFDFDYLVPCFADEVLPGDDINLSLNCFARFATQKVPVMDRSQVDFFFFFVPNRLVWDHWENFMGASDDHTVVPDYQVPQLVVNGTNPTPSVGTLWDKFGLPTDVPYVSASATVCAFPFRGYYKIWNDWFRAEFLQDALPFSKDDGPDLDTEYVLQKRNKAHDYFTSALDRPQRGPAVELPLGTRAPIFRADNAPKWLAFNSATNVPAGTGDLAVDGLDAQVRVTSLSSVSFDPQGGLYTDLSTATAATINQLRQAFAFQAMYELDNRGGTRYVEILLAHFNVISPDFRLARSEYLGGGSVDINVHPVAQTSPTSGSNVQAQLAAFATASSAAQGSRVGFSKSFVEHGWVIGIMCAKTQITYQQGVNRKWLRLDRFDYFWPKLQEIGEQVIYNQEIFLGQKGGVGGDFDAWGYIPRYDDYRFCPSEIRGQFRSSFAQSLDLWHYAEEFSALPALNSDFIEQNSPVERTISVTDAPHLLIDMWFQYHHTRAMVTHAVPSTLGRF